MPTLRVDLQEGFKNDAVTVRVDGREVFRKSSVTTRSPVGVAESFGAATDGEVAKVGVEVTTRKLTGEREVNVGETAYLAVSIEGDRVVFMPSRELFRYM